MANEPYDDAFQNSVPGEIWKMFAGHIKGRFFTFSMNQSQVDSLNEPQLNALAVFEQLALLQEVNGLRKFREWVNTRNPEPDSGREVINLELVRALAARLHDSGFPWDDKGVAQFQADRRFSEKGVGKHTSTALLYAVFNPEMLVRMTPDQIAQLPENGRNALRLFESLSAEPRIVGDLKRMIGDRNPAGTPAGKEYVQVETLMRLVQVAADGGVDFTDAGINAFRQQRWIEESGIGPHTSRAVVFALSNPETLYLISKQEFGALPEDQRNAFSALREIGKDVPAIEELKRILGAGSNASTAEGKIYVGPDDVAALLSKGAAQGIEFTREGIEAFKARRLIHEDGIGEATAKAIVRALTSTETLYTITPAQATKLPSGPRNAFALLSILGRDPKRLAVFKDQTGLPNPAGAPPGKVFISTQAAWQLVQYAQQCGLDLSEAGVKRIQAANSLPQSGSLDMSTALVVMQLLTPPGGPVPGTEADAYTYFRRLLHHLQFAFSEEEGHVNLIGVQGMANSRKAPDPSKMWSDSIFVLWRDAKNQLHCRLFPATFRGPLHRDERGALLPHLEPGRYTFTRGAMVQRDRSRHAVPPTLDGQAGARQQTAAARSKHLGNIIIAPFERGGAGERLPAEAQIIQLDSAAYQREFASLLDAHPFNVMPYTLIRVAQIPGL